MAFATANFFGWQMAKASATSLFANPFDIFVATKRMASASGWMLSATAVQWRMASSSLFSSFLRWQPGFHALQVWHDFSPHCCVGFWFLVLYPFPRPPVLPLPHTPTQQQTTTNNNKQQQTTTNNNKQQQTTTNNNKQQQTTSHITTSHTRNITQHHTTSNTRNITRYDTASHNFKHTHNITRHHATSNNITQHHITSHSITSRHIRSHPVTSGHITSHTEQHHITYTPTRIYRRPLGFAGLKLRQEGLSCEVPSKRFIVFYCLIIRLDR